MKLFLVALLVASSRAQVEKIDPLLTGGAVALVGEFPSAVFIRSPGTPGQPFCGGTIIDTRHVLTSAQCVLNNLNQLINPFWYTITGGDISITVPTNRREERKVSRIFVHPNFNPTTRNK
jgi:secreted trypsin-like serine protease